jgi:hypothetical protein
MITRRSVNALVPGGTDPRAPTRNPGTHGLFLYTSRNAQHYIEGDSAVIHLMYST